MGMTASSARGFMRYSEREERRTCAPRVYQFFQQLTLTRLDLPSLHFCPLLLHLHIGHSPLERGQKKFGR